MTDPVRRVLLVGFMGSGKSTVGPRVADALGWTFHDVDRVVEARAGKRVADIFATDGEARFRRMEDDAARDLLRRDRVVVGSGGGWAAVEGRLQDLPPGTVSVWLRVSPEEAVRRAGRQPGERPLLDVEDPLAAARALLLEREPRYARAQHEVDTTGRSPEDVSRSITRLIHRSEP